jgi:Fe-Mn family superoxide dismutase
MIQIDRRALLTLAAAGSALATAAPASAAAPAAFQPRPLGIDPAKVPGLSAQIISSHYDNNYQGAVRRLNAIEASLAALDPAQAPVFTLNGLKREELVAWNSMILHELYFAGLGAGKPAPTGPLAQAIERDFGSYTRWAAEFSAMGKALGGGSGWVLLTWSARDRRLTNQWAADHTMTLAGGTPILALDMYEHAYHMDYGARAAAYVDAHMKAFDWRNAETLYGRLAG